MALAIFDLDETLLAGDSDQSFGQFIVDKGIVDSHSYALENDRFHEHYQQGVLDIDAYLRFCLKVLGDHSVEQLHLWREEFIDTIIKPIVLPKGLKKIAEHRAKGDFILIITATNRFVTGPIAEMLKVDHLLATNVEIRDGQYTGLPVGVPCFKEGKITNLNSWLEATSQDMAGSYFYSDSRNDIPLLERVDNPVVVDPDDVLRKHAETSGWPITSFR